MKRSLLDLLADPESLADLSLVNPRLADERILSGELHAPNGTSYPIESGIPRMVQTDDVGQLQTSDAFGFKWKRRDTYDSAAVKESSAAWLVEKYGFSSFADWASYYDQRQRILDIGCGSGLSSSLWLDCPHWSGRAMWVGADISRAIDVAQERLGHIPNTHFVQGDALHLPFRDGSFDTLFSEGVLHHTPSTRAALHAAARVLAPGGEFHFYVYRRKGPVREFTDDYIRATIADRSDEQAWEDLRSLTQLGQALAELHATIEISEDIPLLGIKAGQHDVQRLIYWHFAKLFWNPTWSFEENLHVNFDWYRPRYAHRQSEAELREWCAEANLAITWFHEQESGFTVRAVRR